MPAARIKNEEADAFRVRHVGRKCRRDPMGTKDPRIDAYIATAQPFARPILSYIRKAVHGGCPEVEETLKWRHPSFMYKGILCGIIADAFQKPKVTCSLNAMRPNWPAASLAFPPTSEQQGLQRMTPRKGR
jgi:hypothetical protein